MRGSSERRPVAQLHLRSRYCPSRRRARNIAQCARQYFGRRLAARRRPQCAVHESKGARLLGLERSASRRAPVLCGDHRHRAACQRTRHSSRTARRMFRSPRRAGAHAGARDTLTPDRRHIRVHCAVTPNGGRMLTYCDISDLVRSAEQLEKLATIDSMTGLFNRRHFLALAAAEWSRFLRYQRPLSMLAIDVDHFKSVNDRYGHAVGDEAIASVAATCQQCKRASDIVGRIGAKSSPFCCRRPEQAAIVAERIREKVAGQVLFAHKVRFGMTISIGIASATAGMSGIEALLRPADQALYQAKAEGRNRAVQGTPPLVPKFAAE